MQFQLGSRKKEDYNGFAFVGLLRRLKWMVCILT